MAGGTITIDVKDEGVTEFFRDISSRCLNKKPVLSAIGQIVHASVVRNFEKGGRPNAWARLSPTTKAQRARKGKWPGKTLLIQGFAGGLLGSIHPTVGTDNVSVGTDKAYAAVHQFGARKGSFGTFSVIVKEHMRKPSKGKPSTIGTHSRKQKLPWGDIPARPFLLVQPEDWDEIRATMLDYLIGR